MSFRDGPKDQTRNDSASDELDQKYIGFPDHFVSAPRQR
jgi:hypothetical protein